MLKLSLKSFGCLSDDPDCLLVIAVYNWSDAGLEVKLAKEVVPPYNF